jgi:hypothetical protein
VINTSGVRVYYAYARDGALPFSNWLSTVNGVTRTPIHATIAFSVLCALVGLISLGSSTALHAFFSGASLAGATSYLMPVLMRCIYEDNPDYIPGPFTLGKWSRPIRWVAVAWTRNSPSDTFLSASQALISSSQSSRSQSSHCQVRLTSRPTASIGVRCFSVPLQSQPFRGITSVRIGGLRDHSRRMWGLRRMWLQT